MSDISDNIIKILNDNGVSVQIENIWGSTGTDPKVVRRNINLDFSEHDKVFEDKIAEQKNEISMLKSLIDNYSDAESKLFDENKELKQRISELVKELEEWKEEARAVKKQRDEQLKSFREGIKPYVDLLHMHETIADKNEKIAELEKGMGNYKQAFEDKCNDYNFTSDLLDKFILENEALEKRIAELESKETEKPTKCTTVIVAKEINGQTYVTLDDFMSVVNDFQAEIGT